MSIDPSVEFEEALEPGTVFFHHRFLTIVLDTGEDHDWIEFEDSDLETGELDGILVKENMIRTGDWYITEEGEMTTPVLVGVKPGTGDDLL